MRILDCTCSSRSIWINKNNPDVIYCDIRRDVEPQIISSVVNLPFRDNSFNVVVFDPPHKNNGEGISMSEHYGVFNTAEILNMTIQGFIEINRVLAPDGLCLFKWNNHDIIIKRIIKSECPLELLFGQLVSYRTKHSSQTEWYLLRSKK